LAAVRPQTQVLPPAGADDPKLAAALNDVTAKMSLLVREEIELAKAEVSASVTKLVRGAIVGVAAGIFAVIGLLFFVHGLAWLTFYVLPVGDQAVFWGYFIVAVLLFIAGAVAGLLAYRAVKSGGVPIPTMAIDEAKRIAVTARSPEPRKTI
jgi:uncharacterized membrane protein YqjE